MKTQIKKQTLILLYTTILLAEIACGQSSSLRHTWIFFRDKSTPFLQSTNPALLGISERTLKRRAKVLPADRLIDRLDLPVSESFIAQIKQTGAKIRTVSRWFNAVSVEGTQQQIQAINKLIPVSATEEVAVLRRSKPTPSSISSSASPLMKRSNSKNLENLFYKPNFKKYLYPQTLITIKKLKNLGDVKIFSLGDRFYQSLKIKNSGIEEAVGRKNVIVVQDKKIGLREVLSKLFKKYGYITIVDDRSDVLESAFQINPEITTIWIKHGEYEDITPIRKDSITYSAHSLSEASTFLESFVETIKQNKLDGQISVIREIYETYPDQLIKYSEEDKIVDKFTHDRERFKNKKLFDNWRKHGKTIYVLTSSNQKLLGIVWFAKEKFEKYEYTFAIRMYSYARGKGLSYQFMKICFKNFNKHGFWLTTVKSNKAAIATYKKFGFRQRGTKNGKILMTLN